MKEIKQIVLNYRKEHKVELKVFLLALGITILVSSIPVVALIQAGMLIYSSGILFNIIILVLFFSIMLLYNYCYYDIYRNMIPELKEKNILLLSVVESIPLIVIIFVIILINVLIGKWW